MKRVLAGTTGPSPDPHGGPARASRNPLLVTCPVREHRGTIAQDQAHGISTVYLRRLRAVLLPGDLGAYEEWGYGVRLARKRAWVATLRELARNSLTKPLAQGFVADMMWQTRAR